MIRQTSLSGVANRYISLTPGPNNSPEIEHGVDDHRRGHDHAGRHRPALQHLPPPRARGAAEVHPGQRHRLRRQGRARQPRLQVPQPLAEHLDEALRTSSRSDSVSLSRFLVSGSQTFGALADRREDLTSLIATAQRDAGGDLLPRTRTSTARSRRLPETLRQTNTTFVNLRATLDDLDPLVQASYPATKNAAPFLRKTAKVANDSRPVFTKLADIARLPGQNNDLADTLKKLPTVKQRGGNGAAGVDQGDERLPGRPRLPAALHARPHRAG